MLLKRERVRGMLAEYSLSQVWLCSQLNKRGVEVSTNELCLYVTGRRRGAKADEIINSALEILDLYVNRFEEYKPEKE